MNDYIKKELNDYIKETDDLTEALKCSNTPKGWEGKDCFKCKYHIEQEVGREYGEKFGCRKREGVYIDTDCDMEKILDETIAKLGAFKVHVQADAALMETEGLTPKQVWLEGYDAGKKEGGAKWT